MNKDDKSFVEHAKGVASLGWVQSDKAVLRLISIIERQQEQVDLCKRQIVDMACYPIDKTQVRSFWIKNEFGPEVMKREELEEILGG